MPFSSKNFEPLDVLFLSDKHVGSRVAVWHPDYEFKENPGVTGLAVGSKWTLNGVQQKIWEDWCDFCKWVKQFKPNAQATLGDVITGPEYKGQGNENVTSNLNEQGNCCVKLLRMVPLHPKAKKIGLLGSGYHDARYYNVNQSITETIGGEFYGPAGIFTFNGHNVRLYHGSTKSYIYLEMIMGRRRAFAQESIAKQKLPEFEAIINGHNHTWLHMRRSWRNGKDFHIVLVPGWQSQTGFLASHDPDKLIPEIGGVIAHFYKDEIQFERKLYPTPLALADPVEM